MLNNLNIKELFFVQGRERPVVARKKTSSSRIVGCSSSVRLIAGVLLAVAVLCSSSISLVNSQTVQQCSYESNMDYFGSDLSSYPIFTASSDLCCSACTAHPVCQAWTYVPNSQACWLKYAVGVRRFNADGSMKFNHSALILQAIQYFNRVSGVSGVKQQTSPFPPLFNNATVTATTATTVTVTATITVTPTLTTLTVPTTVTTVTTTAAGITTAPVTSTSTIASSTVLAGCFIENNVNYPGNDLSTSAGNVLTAFDCCNLCGNDPNCASWAYLISSSYCFLKSSLPSSSNRQPYTGIISGVVVA